MSRGFLICFLGLLLGLSVIFGAMLFLKSDRAPRENPTRSVIHYISADEWPTFALDNPTGDVGWVALPPPQDGDLYSSPRVSKVMTPQDCRDCHAEIVESFLTTAHARTTTLPSDDTILGEFSPPENHLGTSLEGFYFEMVRQGDEYIQVVHASKVGEAGEDLEIRVPIAFVVGSGNHGQSYLHWEGDQLCQMPVSYFSEFDRWTNSPGTYLDGTADFARPATNRCLDCHNTWFGHDPRSINRFDRSQWILGVTCVRCHGPANEHVQYHRLYPTDVEPQFIVNPSNLELERQYEVCAQCHSGGGELRRPAFSYEPGDPLLDYLDIDLASASEAADDPHSANQLGRLMRSRCFQQSTSLTCINCHDPHRHERGNMELFSRRCHSCHDVDNCQVRERLGSVIDLRCIECHMPSRRDAEVTAAGVDGGVIPLLRDHMIGIWPDVSRQVEGRLPLSQDFPESTAASRSTTQ